MGNTTRKKVRSGPQPVNGGRFLNFMGQSLHKAQEHENGKSCTETQIHHRNGVRGIQLQLIAVKVRVNITIWKGTIMENRHR